MIIGMSRARSLLTVLLALALLCAAGDRGGRVLCFEPDGCVSVEDAGGLCCGDGLLDSPREPTLTGVDECCACVDILLPGQGASRPASAARALDGLALASAAAAVAEPPLDLLASLEVLSPRPIEAPPPFARGRADLSSVSFRC